MPLFVPKTLLQAAQGGAQTKRYRDFVIAYFEGEGAIAVPNPIWQPAASWAGGRQPSGNRMRDRGLLLQRLDVLLTRRGTTVTSTTGGLIPLARLRNAMKSEGVDIKDWNFPPDDVLDKALDPGSGKDGKFTFRHLAPGRYWLVAQAADEEFKEAVMRPAAWDSENRAKLRREGEAAGVVVDLAPCQRLNDYALPFPPRSANK